MTCACGPEVTVQGYQNQQTVPIPAHMAAYRKAREREGLSGDLSIDRCILPELQSLWSKGVRTGGSCCGHNILPSMINALTKEDGHRMQAMGYVLWPSTETTAKGCWGWTFYSKTIPGRFP